ETYRWIAVALRRGLRGLGAAAEIVAVPEAEGPTPAFCFARTGRYEIEIGGKKVVGSAQSRKGTCFLQHGAVILGVDEPRLRAVFPTTRDPLATMTTLEAALGHRPKFEEVAVALERAFEEEHGLTLRPGGLSPEETARVAALVAEKYGTDAWLAGAAWAVRREPRVSGLPARRRGRPRRARCQRAPGPPRWPAPVGDP